MKRIFTLLLILFLNVETKAQCWQTISAGNLFTAAIKTDGTLWTWGDYQYGQLGIGAVTSDAGSPVQVGTANDWVFVTANWYTVFAIKSNGTLWAWGQNTYGKLGDGTQTNRNVPVQIGTDANWQSVSSNINNTVAIKIDGSLWSWGGNLSGQVGDGTYTNRYAPVRIGTANDWVSVSVGNSHTLAKRSDNTIWVWGVGLYGQMGLGTVNLKNVPTQIGTNTDWNQIEAGYGHSVAIKNDGTLWTWGYNANGQLGDNTTVNKNVPTQVGTDTNWQKIKSYEHNLAVKTNGTLWAWGLNGGYQLGDNTLTNRLMPFQLVSVSNVTKISAGGHFSFVQDTNGSTYAFGDNSDGMLGTGDYLQKRTPTLIFQCSGLGLKESLVEEFKIYPNPTNGNFNIEVAQDLIGSKATIYNFLGQKVKDFSLKSSTTNQTLNKGIYLLEIEKEGSKTTKKLIVN